MKDVKRDHNVTKSESKKMVDRLFKTVKDNRGDFEKFLRNQAKKVIDELDLATKKDLRNFKKKR